jgi:hypothetical protein
MMLRAGTIRQRPSSWIPTAATKEYERRGYHRIGTSTGLMADCHPADEKTASATS